MRIGVPREIKNQEFRVGLTPAGVQALVAAGHDVMVETRAGAAVGFDDTAYRAAGARMVAAAQDAYAGDLVIKVKELQPAEFMLARPAQILFCYQHLAPDPPLLAALLGRKVSCIAYETVSAPDGSLPLLVPMSEIAGRLAIQVGAWALQMTNGGSGVLLAGVPGVAPGKVVIVGGGTVGTNAACIAVGLGADVTLLDRSPPRLRMLEQLFGARLKTRIAEPQAVSVLVRDADLVVGIDQGGIAETSRATSHTDPVYVDSGVIHYCVPNMPSAVARTATLSLTQATLPYVMAIAAQGLRAAMAADAGLRDGLQLHAGQVTHRELAADVKRPYVPALEALA